MIKSNKKNNKRKFFMSSKEKNFLKIMLSSYRLATKWRCSDESKAILIHSSAMSFFNKNN